MAISSVTSKVVYVGDGATLIFPYPFKIFAEGDLVVSDYIVATASANVLTLNTDYLVSGVGSDAGGNVTLSGSYTNLPTGSRLVIERIMDVTQEVDYVENDPFPAQTLENALDKMTMINQQLQEQLNRTIKSDISTISAAVTYIIDAEVATSSAVVAIAHSVLASNYAGAIDFQKDTDGALTSNSDLFVATQKATKTYVISVGTTKVSITGDQDVAGTKSFTSVPVLPASDPTADDQASRKKYVDDSVVPSDARIKAWLQFNGTGTIAIQDSFNISSIVDNGVGNYTINWDVDFANDDYAVFPMAGNQNDATFNTLGIRTLGVSACIVLVGTTDGTPVDRNIVCIEAIGDQ